MPSILCDLDAYPKLFIVVTAVCIAHGVILLWM